MASGPEVLHFDVSSGLKSVLGGDLITDDEVAIFELVKNSFDAGAHNVLLRFDKNSITVADDGKGMSYEDIKSKWLFVAYSEKRDANKAIDFRDGIADRRSYAGSKGIGRFSSDRLGRKVILQSRSADQGFVGLSQVEVDWPKFDEDHATLFQNVEVHYSRLSNFSEVLTGIDLSFSGTAISIKETRVDWGREKILRLKSALAKLINPFGAEVDGFNIFVVCPEESRRDDEILEEQSLGADSATSNSIVNGVVGNFIFSTLQEKTTFIDVAVVDDGSVIESRLIDRGELIYHIREPNRFKQISHSGFRSQVFFLNQSAKLTFARRMGVPSVQFGSVFLFRNGFRVFPVGESGDDWFGMDRRKQQGYARFLGTRDVIGRVDVIGHDGRFEESSSRNTGLKENDAVAELRKCFRELCLIRLERYVVPVTFVDKEDKNTSDVSRLMTEPGRARVTAAVAKLVDDSDVELIDYSKKLVSILSERSSQFETSLVGLRAIAEKTNDFSLLESLDNAEKKFAYLKESEERARVQADEERKAKEVAQARAKKAEELAERINVELDEEKKRNLFLTSISTLETDTILNLHHQVTIYSVDIQQQIENFLVNIAGRGQVSVSEVVDALDSVAFLNRKIMGVSKFATKANFRLESEFIQADLSEYIVQYINGVAKEFLSGPISLDVTTDGKPFEIRFKPIDVAVVVDNFISNSRRARATRVSFDLTRSDKNILHIVVADNGKGFEKSIDDLERIFEKGYTKTVGSGLGLYHVRHVLGEMNGTIQPVSPVGVRGAEFKIRIAK
ncbi:ATP-binding protein [Pseudomonas monteilii]|uniref:ATP-binding protein n=1 Tax=Pseudomonas monteilii TaxID=76759 RepID=UPI003CFE5C9C